MNRPVRVAMILVCGAVAGWLLAQMGTGLRPVHAQGKAEARNFEIRHLSLKNGNREIVRFSPTKGDAWLYTNNQWEKLPEAGPVPSGDYEMVLAEAVNNAFWATRFERNTGRAWNLSGGKWFDIAEKR